MSFKMGFPLDDTDEARLYERRAKQEQELMRQQQAIMNQRLDELSLSPSAFIGTASNGAGMTSGASMGSGSLLGGLAASGIGTAASQAQITNNQKWQQIQQIQAHAAQSIPWNGPGVLSQPVRNLSKEIDELREIVSMQAKKIKSLNAKIDKMSLTPSAKSVEDISSQMENFIC